ncbi:MAG: hypothetical protein IT453_07730 [Planctomycetes bacterium]|nr:hypothetical protein [Planctomycetota bacterium]
MLSEPTRRVIAAARAFEEHFGESMHPLQVRQLAHDTPGASYHAALIALMGCGLDRDGERVWLACRSPRAVHVRDREASAALVLHGLDRIRARLVHSFARVIERREERSRAGRASRSRGRGPSFDTTRRRSVGLHRSAR